MTHKKKKKQKWLVSDGLVGSPECGSCETCGALPKGTKYRPDKYGNTYWCEACVEAGAK